MARRAASTPLRRKSRLFISAAYVIITLGILYYALFAGVGASSGGTPLYTDVAGGPVYVRRGFDASEVGALPKLSPGGWQLFQGAGEPGAALRIRDSGLPGLPKRTFMSPFGEKPQEFTMLFGFALSADKIAYLRADPTRVPGLCLASIGENWQIFVNGRLVKSEMHLGEDGRILSGRAMRDVMFPMDRELLAEGENIIALRIVGDPTYASTGLLYHRSYFVDVYQEIEANSSSLLLIALCGIYFFIGAYHLMLFFGQNRDLANLFHSLVSFALGIYTIMRDSRIYIFIKDAAVATRIEYVVLFVSIPAFGAFMESLTQPKRFRLSPASKAYVAFSAFISVTAATLPLAYADDALDVWNLLTLAYVMYIIFFVAVRALFRETHKSWNAGRGAGSAAGVAVGSDKSVPAGGAGGDIGARPPRRACLRALLSTPLGNSALASSIMAGCAIFDVIDTLFIYNSYGLFRYGFFIFISISTYSLAERFDSLLTQLDASNTALDEANMALEATVKERTRELEQKARELEEQARLAEEASDAATLASKAKSEFLAHMSHEIRTPMNAILGLLELIQRKELPPDVREHAMVMKTAGGNLLSIINDILDFSKIESGKLEIVPAKYSLASLINDAVSITRARLANKPLLFTVDVSSALPVSLVGDEARLRQILINLLSNALKYTREGHFSMRVDGEPRGDGMFALRFEVSDTGIGIRKDDIGKLFRDFTQLDASRHKSVEGTGLGLAITRNLCVAMEGSIDVQSEYGKGSRFTAVIPQAADGDCSGGSCLASVQAREGKNILVLDDRPVCARSIANALNSLGVSYRLVSAVAEFSAALAAAGGDSAVGDMGDAAGDAPSAVGAGTMAGDGSAAGDGEEHRPFSHLFVASAFAEEARRASDEQFARDSAERPGRRPAFVTLANPADAANAANGDVLEMPAHAISIANLLNDASGHSAGPEAPGGEADGSDPQFTAAGARVLIVDDIDINLFVMEGLLEPYEIKADVCLSGKEAIELARENRYDIIFMDHMMPEMDGIEATAAIRTLGGAGAGAIPEPAPADAFAASPDSPGGEYYSTLPIVALTANAVVGQREVFLQNGMSDFLAKPIELHKLNAILRKWLPKEKQA